MGSGRQGKCCGCVATVHVLIRGDLLHMRFILKSAAIGNGCRDGAEVSRGRSRQGRHHSWRCGGWKQAGIESRKTYPAEGPNSKRGMSFSMSFQSTSKSVRAGAGARHGNSAPQDIRSYCRLIKELRLSLTGYGPSLFGNRRMRTRMYGGVGAGGENPPATRLCVFYLFKVSIGVSSFANSLIRRILGILNIPHPIKPIPVR